MKKIILSAAFAAFALGHAPAMADTLPVKVIKTRIPDGCEYKKIPGKKKKELVCIDDITIGGDGGSAMEDGASAVDPDFDTNIGDRRGKGQGASNGGRNPNNGIGNGSTDGIPGGSGKTKAASNDTQ